MALKGFKIKIRDQKIVSDNNLNPNALYEAVAMDNDFYYIELNNGMEVEVPINSAELVTREKLMTG